MRILGVNDKKDYSSNANVISRTSARCIIIEDNKIYLSYSKKNNYYKLPGGGVDKGEIKKASAARESLEEVGVEVDMNQMTLYGVYIDKWKSVKAFEPDSVWVNKSYYYICKRKGPLHDIKPTKSEIEEECMSVLVDIDVAIKANEDRMNSPLYNIKERYLERENDIFRLIKEELL